MATEKDSLKRQRITEFRETVSDVLQGEYELTEPYLDKWLRRNKYDVKKSEIALRKFKCWEIKKKLDEGLQPDFTEVSIDLPIQFCGFDKEGCPVTLFNLGVSNMDKYSRCKRVDEMSTYLAHYLETLCKHIHEQHLKTNGAVNHFVCIIDMDGFTLRKCFNTDLIKMMIELIKLVESYYPDFGKDFHVINMCASSVASLLLKVASPFMDAETLARIHIYGTNHRTWKSRLIEIVPDLKQYPESLRDQLKM